MNEDKATRYHRLKRQASVVSLLWSVALLTGVLWSGWTLTLRSLAESAAPYAGSGFSRMTAIVVYVCLLTLLNEIGGVPIAFYSGFLLERRYGLSNERFAPGCAIR